MGEQINGNALIDAAYRVIIGHCVSLAWDSRTCDRQLGGGDLEGKKKAGAKSNTVDGQNK